MDQIIEVMQDYENVKFFVSLDYSSNETDLYTCNEWANLYQELGDHNNNPLIIDGDPSHNIWNMFAGSTYSAYALIDHNMVLRYKFDIPNLYDFQFIYIPTLIESMYGCTDSNACNYVPGSVYDDDSCQYDAECDSCNDALNQLDCMALDDCMWMGDHCMHSVSGCMNFDNEFDCIQTDGCYWMGNHCMPGSSCTDPIAFNYNPIADSIGFGDDSTCQYSSSIIFGCTYESALNYNPAANVDDQSCEYSFGDINHDGILDILDLVSIVNIILNR